MDGITRRNKFVFILSPPYCGSTLLTEILSTSDHVSVNNTYGNREGQRLPQLEQIMFNHDRRWDETLDFDWEFIKSTWLNYWDLEKPILLEKSPPNIIRAKSIKQVFNPAYFIIMTRNPYAHCESLMRRATKMAAVNAAEFAIRCLKIQQSNLNELNQTLGISYELLTDNPKKTVESLCAFLPELQDLDVSKKFSAHNLRNSIMKIQNLNKEKIDKLSQDDKEIINSVFHSEQKILDYWGYKLRE